MESRLISAWARYRVTIPASLCALDDGYPGADFIERFDLEPQDLVMIAPVRHPDDAPPAFSIKLEKRIATAYIRWQDMPPGKPGRRRIGSRWRAKQLREGRGVAATQLDEQLGRELWLLQEARFRGSERTARSRALCREAPALARPSPQTSAPSPRPDHGRPHLGGQTCSWRAKARMAGTSSLILRRPAIASSL